MMAHQYRQRILVTLRANGEPGGIFWRGAAYSVDEVLARWHLRDRWWAARDGQAGVAGDPAAGDPAADTRGAAGVHRTPLQVAEDNTGGCRSAEGVRRTPPQGTVDDWHRGAEVPAYGSDGLKFDHVPSNPGTVSSDRYYYRLRCVEGLLCEVYWDAASGAWTLDRVLD